jgi:outer membrane protein assembly factor BamB
MRRMIAHISLALTAVLVATRATAENWPGWRGPTGVGISSERDLPVQWDGKTGKNVLWKAPLPDCNGNSGPIVWGEHVFVTTASRQTQAQQERKEIPDHQLWCFRTTDGECLWKATIKPGSQLSNGETYAAPTPTTDGKAVYCWFGSAVAAAVDFDGNILWRQEQPGPYNVNPGISSSPVLFQQSMLLVCDQADDRGWLRALDTATGKVKWELARKKLSHSNATPVLIRVGSSQQLVVQASDRLQGLDPADGKPIWWCKARGFGASPAFGSGLIYSDSGNDESGLVVSPQGKGDVTESHVKWQAAKVTSQYQSAVVVGKYIYRAQKPGLIRCVELETGDQVYLNRAQGVPTVSSPVATADDRVYFVTATKSYVIKAGPQFEVLAVNELGGGGEWSSPAIADGKLFVRGEQTLYCVGNRAQ